jgi:CheY-like chemotaxis protein/two-component sensor histidine kinase
MGGRAASSDPALASKGLSVIERNAQAQAKLIDDILDVARIVSGKLELDVARIDTAAAIHSAVESVRPAASAKGIALVIETSARPRIDADDARFQQIAWNLLANAVKFTPKGGEVRLRTFERDDRFHLAVSDTGRGITPSFLPHVFDRFRQDDSSTTKHHAGLGLGLAIVRHLVELHGGTVEARSDGEGRGATFEVALPLRTRDGAIADSEPTPSPSDDRLARARLRLKSACVLVVEDQRDGRELVAFVLESAGARVIEASSAQVALDVLATTDVSAIVSDVGMPDEDGYRFIERVRSSTRNQHAPALALTAFARAEDRARAIAAGFQDHLPKPIDPMRLLDAVVALLA